jgi:type IV pilus assembly protein PilB
MSTSSGEAHTLPCDEWQRRITAYADGELSEGESARLEAHVASCAACAPVLTETRRMKSVLPAWTVDERYIAERVEARIAEPPAQRRHDLADVLAERRAITLAQLEAARAVQESAPGDVGRILLDLGFATEREVVEARALSEGVPFLDLTKHKPEPSALAAVPAELARSYRALPIKRDGWRLWTAMENPKDVPAVDALRQASGCTILPMAAVPPDLAAALEVAYPAVDERSATFDQVHKRYEQRVFNLLRQLTGDREAAEDLTVETFVTAYRQWDRLREREQILPTLIEIAVGTLDAKHGGGRAGTIDGERLSATVRALRSAPEFLEVAILAEDATYEEIAAETGLTVPAVKARLHRARRMLRDSVPEPEPPEANDTATRLLLDELRAIREEMAALRAEVAGLRREAAARQGATVTVRRAAEAPPQLLPYAPPSDAPTPLS